jgi:hypothetical protein
MRREGETNKKQKERIPNRNETKRKGSGRGRKAREGRKKRTGAAYLQAYLCGERFSVSQKAIPSLTWSNWGKTLDRRSHMASRVCCF